MEIKPFKGQVYEDLKRQYSRNRPFEDREFPATTSSMYFSSLPSSLRNVRWKRPTEVMRDPQFVVGGFQRCDMDQGAVGNCWFIAGAVGIMQSEKCFAKVVPQDQGFGDDYAGIFHFRFWLYGEWVDVCVDDRLPFYPDGRLAFCSNKQEPNEMWGPLLEKAYAKLYGSYEALEGGFTTDALIDMSGGIEETFELKTMPANEKNQLWTILLQAYQKNSIIGCSIGADPSVKEARMSNGLVRGHAYTVTMVHEFELNGRATRLLRIRNPWGNEVEWRGAWSDNSREWNSVSADVKQDIGLVNDHDGEFWMNFTDFISNWETVQICHLTADSFSGELLETDNFTWRKLNIDTDLCWKCSTYQSEWRTGSTAGGCGQPNMAKFWTNPQFLVTLTDVDKDDNENKATVIVALMQKDTRLKRQELGGEQGEEYIQFRLYRIKDGVEVDENKTTHLRLYSSQLDRIGTSGSYINKREVTKRFRVEPGNYLIIPSTYEEDKDCQFMLRIFTEKPVDANALEEHKDNLDDGDIFFQMEDTDQLFSSWSNFIGNDEDSPRASGGGSRNRSNSSGSASNVKETCGLM